jgi:hypothetical protein
MESNLLNSASDFLYHTHFYFNILSLAAKISARRLHCHKPGTCYSIVSCSPLILIGAHFSSLAINQLNDLSLFKNMTKKRPCSEINAFKNSDPVHYTVQMPNSWMKARQKASWFSSLLSVTYTALPWDLYFFKLTQPLTVYTVQLLYTVKEKGGKPYRRPYPLPYGLRNPYRNLKYENSQDCAQTHLTEIVRSWFRLLDTI